MRADFGRFLWLTLAVLGSASVCLADIGDGEPWDWERYDSTINRSNAANSDCDAVATDMHAPNLKCVFDKKAWDGFLAVEKKKAYGLRDKNHYPTSCRDVVLQFFREKTSNGHLPPATGESKPVIDELGSKIAVINCSFKDTKDPATIEYDPKSKTLNVYDTRKGMSSSPSWVGEELKSPRLRKYFPVTNKYWEDGHPM